MSSAKVKAVGASAATGVALALIAAAPASAGSAAHKPPPLHVLKTLSASFVGPLQFAVSGSASASKIYVADSFTSTLSLIGRTTPVATGPSPQRGGDLAGVAVDPKTGAIAYTTNNGDHSKTALTILAKGKKPVVADLSGFEAKHNPDSKITYGISHPTAKQAAALQAVHIPVRYTGDIDSHAYSVTALGGGAWAVADAGGNDLLKVDRYGHVSVISVLPAQPLKLTKAFAAANGVSADVAGAVYKFEGVPTDVEVGPHGALYVTTLPGGPEGPDAGTRGSVYRIGPGGKTTRIATGFGGATNLALDPYGRIAVAEISKGTISTIAYGKPKTLISLPGVVAVEWANGHLYASTSPAATGGNGPGKVVVLG